MTQIGLGGSGSVASLLTSAGALSLGTLPSSATPGLTPACSLQVGTPGHPKESALPPRGGIRSLRRKSDSAQALRKRRGYSSKENSELPTTPAKKKNQKTKNPPKPKTSLFRLGFVDLPRFAFPERQTCPSPRAPRTPGGILSTDGDTARGLPASRTAPWTSPARLHLARLHLDPLCATAPLPPAPASGNHHSIPRFQESGYFRCPV